MGNGKSRGGTIGSRVGQEGGRQCSNNLPGEWGILVTDRDWGWRGAATDRLPRKAWTGDREQLMWRGTACGRKAVTDWPRTHT